MVKQVTVKLLYGNCNGSRRVSDSLPCILDNLNTDFAIFSDFHKEFSSTMYKCRFDHPFHAVNRYKTSIIFRSSLQRTVINHENFTVISFQYRSINICAICVYFSYKLSTKEFCDALHELGKVMNIIPADIVFVGGDFNADTLMSNKTSITHTKGNILLGWIRQNEFYSSSLNSEMATFVSRSSKTYHRLDHLLIKKRFIIEKYQEEVIELSGADHHIIMSDMVFLHESKDQLRTIFELSESKQISCNMVHDPRNLDEQVNLLENEIGKVTIIKRRTICSRLSRKSRLYRKMLIDSCKKRKRSPLIPSLLDKIQREYRVAEEKKVAHLKYQFKLQPWTVIRKICGKTLKDLIPVHLNKCGDQSEMNKMKILESFDLTPKETLECRHSEVVMDRQYQSDELSKIFSKNTNSQVIFPNGKTIIENQYLLKKYTQLINLAFNSSTSLPSGP